MSEEARETVLALPDSRKVFLEEGTLYYQRPCEVLQAETGIVVSGREFYRIDLVHGVFVDEEGNERQIDDVSKEAFTLLLNSMTRVT